MRKGGTFYNIDKKGGVYICNNCLDEVDSCFSSDFMHTFYWKDLKIIPVGYKENYKIYLTCERCGNTIVVPEEIIPKWRLFRLKCKLVF